MPLNFSEQTNSHHSVPQFLKVRCKKDICMGKRICVLSAIGEQEREIQNAQVLSVSSRSRDKRTYVWAKAERTCVLLAIRVVSMSSKSGDKRTYVCAKSKRTCVLVAIGEQKREIQNAQVLSMSSKSRDKKEKHKKTQEMKFIFSFSIT